MAAAGNDGYFYSDYAQQKYSNTSCFWERQPLGCLSISCAFHHSKPRYINGHFLPPSNNAPLPQGVREGILPPAHHQQSRRTHKNILLPVHPPVIIDLNDEDDEGDDEEEENYVSEWVPKTAADIEEERAIKEACYISGTYYGIQNPQKHQSTKTASSGWGNELLPLEGTKRPLQKEYRDANAPIPKMSSVIVGRIPAGGVKASSKPSVVSMKKPLAAPPPSYVCFRCGKPGHYIKHCPTNGDRNFKPIPRIKKSTGIPRSFPMEVQDPNTKGAMLQNTGKYAVPVINAEAYAGGTKEKPPFLPEQPSSSSSSEDPIPAEFLCPICKEIMTDAAVIPCCGNSYCDKCIRAALVESEEHTCPTCHQTDVSPDALIANQFLRKAVNNFNNGTGYAKRLRQQIQQQQQPPPPLPPPPLMPVAPPGPFCGADSVIPVAALLTAAEPPKSSSLSISSLLEEKVPVLRQPAFPTLLGPQGQPTPTTAGHPVGGSTPRSAGGRPGWELSKTSYSASSHRSSNTCSPSRPGSSRSRSRSRSPSFSRSRSRAYLRSPPYPRRDKGKRQREVPAHDREVYYRRSVDFRDPFERERHREREREHRGRHGKHYKDYAGGSQRRPPASRECSPERFGPPGRQREHSPYARGRREDYPGGQSHRSHHRARN